MAKCICEFVMSIKIHDYCRVFLENVLQKTALSYMEKLLWIQAVFLEITQ
jgi:hypothetical protein